MLSYALRIIPLLFIFSSANATMFIGPTQVQSIYAGTSRVCHGMYGHESFFEEPNIPTISLFGARRDSGTGLVHTLTLNSTELPVEVVIGAASVSNTTSYKLTRIAGSSTSIVQESPSAATSIHYNEQFTSDFHPNSSGWSYILEVRDSAGGQCGFRHAQALVRFITRPTLSAFYASSIFIEQTAVPSVNRQCVMLHWTSTAGSPVATWGLIQRGRQIATLPSARRLVPALGTTGYKVCVASGGSQSTTLVLTGNNEAGPVTRSLTINWLQQ